MSEAALLDSWLASHEPLFSCPPFEGRIVTLQSREEWRGGNVTREILAPGADFFRYRALALDRKTSLASPSPPAGCDIPDEFLVFKSTDDSNLKRLVPESLLAADPLHSILPSPFPPLADSRRAGDPIRPGHQRCGHFTFDGVHGKSELIGPILLNLFVFDAQSASHMTETWTYLVPDLAGKLAREDGFRPFRDSPSQFVIPLTRPEPDGTDSLFLVLVLDRPFMPDAGAAIDAYYVSPKGAAAKKAKECAEKVNVEGWRITFAYSAIRVADIVLGGPLVFSDVVRTE
jgi:hypothetical protein